MDAEQVKAICEELKEQYKGATLAQPAKILAQGLIWGAYILAGGSVETKDEEK